MDNQIKLEDAEPWRRWRYLTTVLAALGYTVCFFTRSALSIAIVAMTDRRNNTNPNIPTFDWDLSTQGFVLSSFFWGYVPTNLVGALLILKYGPRWILLILMTLCSITTLVIPVGAEYGGWPVTCALRIVQGLTQGAYYSSMFTIIASWSTPADRARMGSICSSGGVLGIGVGLSVGGSLASSAGGWPTVFYVFGSISIGWCILWGLLGYDTPADHPFVSEKEKKYIQSFYINQENKSTFYVPWKDLLLSPPIYGMLVASLAQNWGTYTLMTEMPRYIDAILKYNIHENGLLSAAPYMFLLIFTYIFGWLGDVYNRLSFTPKKWNRRIFSSIGFLVPAAAMIALTLIDVSSKESAIALLILSVAGNAAVSIGYPLNSVDLAPNFAAVITGITNGIGSTLGATVPIAAGAIVRNEHDVNQWNIVFWITAGFYLVGTIIYLLIGSQEIQHWNDKKQSKADSSITEEKNNESLKT